MAEALTKIFSRVGVPSILLSDQGSQFVGSVMEEVYRLLSVQHVTISVYHPQSNGLVEKWNGTLKSMLRKLCAERPSDWDRYVEPAMFAYREVPQDSLGFSPFEMLHGRTVRGPLAILKELWTKNIPDEDVQTTYQYVFELRNRLEQTCDLVRQSLLTKQKRYKTYFDRKSQQRNLNVGDKVLVLLPSNSQKLLMQWQGPFEVTEIVAVNDYRVALPSGTKVFHINILKRYFERGHDDSVGDRVETVAAVLSVIDDAESAGEPPIFTLNSRPQTANADRPWPDKVEQVMNTSVPTSKKQLRAFLGFVRCYSRYIEGFATLSAPLTDALRGGVRTALIWGPEQATSFDALKRHLCSDPVLRLPNLTRTFVLRTDASDVGLGAVLLQVFEDGVFPVAYASRKLSDAERNYAIVERECLAVVWAVMKFSLYLSARRFVLQVDNQPLSFLNTAKLSNPRVMRWALAIQAFSFRLEAIRGSDNVGADFLSRAPGDVESVSSDP